jgi:fused signal recognition particle receptor
MFSFFRRRTPPPAAPSAPTPDAAPAPPASTASALPGSSASAAQPDGAASMPVEAVASIPAELLPKEIPSAIPSELPTAIPNPLPGGTTHATKNIAATGVDTALAANSISNPLASASRAWPSEGESRIGRAVQAAIEIAPAPGAATAAAQPTAPPAEAATRGDWLSRLSAGLKKTGSTLASAFVGQKIDDAFWEDLETVLLQADTGVDATAALLSDVRARVQAAGATHPTQARNALITALTRLLEPLEGALVIGEHTPTVLMVAGVNGAGKTTTIGKLTKHLSDAGQHVLLAAGDTFRAAAREQLTVWADRNRVEVISQDKGDPAAVSFDAVSAARARGKDVVLIDTAGRLPTQLHLMDELRKIKRVIAKAEGGAPHEVLLVIDGNTGQNALAQTKAFDDALGLTGLIVTKLDGTAKGGVLAAIARWSQQRQQAQPQARPVKVYFVGVGEKLADLQTFRAREFAQALLG